jgi:thiosulfate/3-mercaptopyruvate sulfurtransferase
MNNRTSMPPLVSTNWLAANLGRDDIRVVDGSWYMPQSGRNAKAEYEAAHIPGAVYFDLDATSDAASALPHMLPPAERFAAAMSALGLDDGSTIVVYDGSGTNLSAPRVWWTLRAFGHPRVAVLDGGFGAWQREGRTVESGEPPAQQGRFTAKLDPTRVRDLEAMRRIMMSGDEQIVDMRSRGRFAGTEPEPRPGLRGGHIPGSLNLPYTELVGTDGRLLPAEELRRRIEAAGVDPAKPIVATCGSGTTACALALSLAVVGLPAPSVYDGSWTEWGGRQDTAVETDEAGRS